MQRPSPGGSTALSEECSRISVLLAVTARSISQDHQQGPRERRPSRVCDVLIYAADEMETPTSGLRRRVPGIALQGKRQPDRSASKTSRSASHTWLASIPDAGTSEREKIARVWSLVPIAGRTVYTFFFAFSRIQAPCCQIQLPAYVQPDLLFCGPLGR